LHKNSTTYTKQWERVVPHHGINNAMDHQFATCKVMAMKLIPPKTHAIRVKTRQGTTTITQGGSCKDLKIM